MAGAEQHRRVLDQAIEPGQFVVELGTGLQVAIRQIQASHNHSGDRRLEIPALVIRKVARQLALKLHRWRALRQNCHPVPGALPLPQAVVARLQQWLFGETGVQSLQLLQAGNVWLLACQPLQQPRQPALDSVDVVRCDLHGVRR